MSRTFQASFGHSGLTFLFIVISFFLAFLAQAMSLSAVWQMWRPSWVFLVLVFWCWRAPQLVGLTVALVAGLGLDILNDTALGMHAFALIWVAYGAHVLQRSLHLSESSQQLWALALLSMFYHVVLNVCLLVVGSWSFSWVYFAPVMSSLLLWPVFAWCLDRVFVHFNLTQRSFLRE